MSSATGNNNDNGRMAMYVLVMVVSALMLLFFVCSCKTTEYVEVPVVHTEYVYKESKDTAYVRDSVYIKEVQKGDTIRITEYRDRYRFRYITTTDTIIRVDSVAVPYPVPAIPMWKTPVYSRSNPRLARPSITDSPIRIFILPAICS